MQEPGTGFGLVGYLRLHQQVARLSKAVIGRFAAGQPANEGPGMIHCQRGMSGFENDCAMVDPGPEWPE